MTPSSHASATHTAASHAPSRRAGRRLALRGGERGQAMVEFALVVPILITIVFAAIEFGDAYWKYQQLSAATSEGARKAIVSRNEADRENLVIQTTRDSAPNLDAADIGVTIDSTWVPGESLTVTSTYPEKITILGITLFDDDLTSTRTMRVEQ